MEVVHLNQKQLAVRWNISEASLERWRTEGCTGELYRGTLCRSKTFGTTSEQRFRDEVSAIVLLGLAIGS